MRLREKKIPFLPLFQLFYSEHNIPLPFFSWFEKSQYDDLSNEPIENY